MIKGKGFASLCIFIMGERSLLSIAQSNLLYNMQRISRVRTHTYLSNNAQTQHGISHNFGAERYYCWADTTIDCRGVPGLVNNTVLEKSLDRLLQSRRFQKIKSDIEERMGGHVTLEPFVTVVRGEDNMRYNLRRGGKIDDFDIVRVGFKLIAGDEAAFKAGLYALAESENPFRLRAVHPLDRGLPA